jgi:hypothetical protein
MNLHPAQRRTVIIRGRGQNEMDSLLPIFANLVEKNTPADPENFETSIMLGLQDIFPNHTNKTHRNYLTEIIGQLFAMYFIEEGKVQLSPLALKLIQDGDQPAFFKILVSRLQFPNPSAKKNKYDDEVSDRLCSRPLVLTLEVLKFASQNETRITFQEIAYYILNNSEALKGEITAHHVYSTIIGSREAKINLPEFEGSAARQHIKEALNLLVLSNLVRSENNTYWLNSLEEEAINEICKSSSNTNLFRSRYENETHDHFQQQWKKYLTQISNISLDIFQTKIGTFVDEVESQLEQNLTRLTANEVGREGELLVLNFENGELRKHFPEEKWQALDLTSRRGIGFDIQSVFYDEPVLIGSNHYIEVKSTLRVTKPNLREVFVPDSFNLTRSEKLAIDSYGELFSVYRVYIHRSGYDIHVLRNPSQLYVENKMKLTPNNWIAEYVPSDIPTCCRVIEVDR